VTQLTIRLAGTEDAGALALLAALDSSRVPAGPLLLAEVDGDLWAAVAVHGGGAIADPFRPSGPLVELLRARARQLVGVPARRRWRGLPRARARGYAAASMFSRT
jgi:hypothetical protein